MKNNIRAFILLLFIQLCIISIHSFKQLNRLNIRSSNKELEYSLSDIAQQLSNNTFEVKYSIRTKDDYNMDCLKAVYLANQSKIGVFHSSKGQTDSYNRLYAAIQTDQNSKYEIISKVSERGSQGTLFLLDSQQSISDNLQNPNQRQQSIQEIPILVAYELENHEHGNTFAFRYYEDLSRLKINNFLYQYQLQQKVDINRVRNIGTPSIQSVLLVKKQNDPKFNQYTIKVKFHYSPDGSHDLPGYGTINVNPLRDFVDKTGKWIGGCKQNYSDWKGSTDQNVLNAVRKLGITGKIGQRDFFYLENSGKMNKYYLYEANLYSDFNWKNWRIILYSQNENTAFPISFVFDKVYDLANPHISLVKRQGSQYTFYMSFFLPSQGMQPGSDATPGEMIAKTKIRL